MSLKHRWLALVFTGLAQAISGCDDEPEPEQEQGFFGTDAEVYGEWDVNALVPDAAVCGRAGITEIEIAFSNDDESVIATDPSFRFPCAVGYFDTPDARLRAGSYGYRWRAYSGAMQVLQSRRYPVTVRAGEEVELMPVDFVRRVNVGIEATLSWDEGGGTAGSCESALVDTMNWELRRGGASGALVASSNGDVACDEVIHIPDLPIGLLEAGTYSLLVNGDAMDGATWGSTCEAVVFESGAIEVGCEVAVKP